MMPPNTVVPDAAIPNKPGRGARACLPKQQPLNRLLEVVAGVGLDRRIFILPHNDPDPDAIASAAGLKALLASCLSRESTVAFQGIVGRAENKALVKFLSSPLVPLERLSIDENDHVILVDTQPDSGNNPLHPGRRVLAVIDHHFARRETDAGFVDIRSHYGATSTIVTEYLRSAGVTIEASLATALFYGIKTDTRGLARHASKADVRAYFFLQQRVDVDALARIETAQVPVDYFRSLDEALHSARVYDGLVTAFLGAMDYPDLTAEIADLLLRLQDSKWIVCCGVYGDTLFVSVRSRGRLADAQTVVHALVAEDGTAGGHGALAGGQVALRGHDPSAAYAVILDRAQRLLGIPPGNPGRPLI